MLQRRRLTRRKPEQILKIFDRDTGRYLGQVGNITQEGIMLVSLTQIRVDKPWQLDMVLETPVDGIAKFSFQARVVWSFRSRGQTGDYWSGFQITHMDNASAEFIARWIQNWEADEE